jgi:hypothetical protein
MLGKVALCIGIGRSWDIAKTIAAIPPIKIMGAIKTNQPDLSKLSKSCLRGTVAVYVAVYIGKKKLIKSEFTDKTYL